VKEVGIKVTESMMNLSQNTGMSRNRVQEPQLTPPGCSEKGENRINRLVFNEKCFYRSKTAKRIAQPVCIAKVLAILRPLAILAR
jgi:hypothetical protein